MTLDIYRMFPEFFRVSVMDVVSGRSICSESLRVLAFHLLLNRRANFSWRQGDTVRTAASSSGLLQITENKTSNLPKIKVHTLIQSLMCSLFSELWYRNDHIVNYRWL
jgi:hypothetical protein